ncbi:hypothetical protein ACBQ54_14590 [Providencia vermicola]|uniref:hypothetical protein n=1 Tax=Providencia vermicola TaxID=333965 RepID=UPI003523A886
MTDKQINFEAIGHCTHLGARISQLIEHRTALYKELRLIASSGELPYESAMNNKDINLEEINKPVELLKKINDTNQSIINAAKAYNSWADKAGYEHYIISGGDNCNISVSAELPVQAFNIGGCLPFSEISAISKAVTDKCSGGIFFKAIAKTETEDQRRIKALELAVERLSSAVQSTKSGWLL